METVDSLLIDSTEVELINDDYRSIEISDLVQSQNYLAQYPNPKDSEIEYLSRESIYKTPTMPQDKFAALQLWTGSVIKIEAEKFYANLYDQTQNLSEEAEFSFEDISEQDMPLLKLGAVFYWSIGYLDKTSGQRLKSSIIKFRRLPVWSPDDLKNALEKAKDIMRNLNIK